MTKQVRVEVAAEDEEIIDYISFNPDVMNKTDVFNSK
jgi:hypothetical protein